MDTQWERLTGAIPTARPVGVGRAVADCRSQIAGRSPHPHGMAETAATAGSREIKGTSNAANSRTAWITP